jgi:hypothetical protein
VIANPFPFVLPPVQLLRRLSLCSSLRFEFDLPFDIQVHLPFGVDPFELDPSLEVEVRPGVAVGPPYDLALALALGPPP